MHNPFKAGRIDVGGTSVDVQVYQDALACPAPLVLHLRGGAFLQLWCGNRLVPGLLAGAGAVVISADYPAGPAHPFPAAAEAMYGLLGHLHDRRTRWTTRRRRVCRPPRAPTSSRRSRPGTPSERWRRRCR